MFDAGRIICFSLTLLITTVSVFAASSLDENLFPIRTNAQRMALGLPPLPPKRLAPILDQRRKHRPTRIRGRHSAPSPSPSSGLVPNAQWMKIQVTRDEDGVFLGYVSRAYRDRVKPFGITPSETGALKVRHVPSAGDHEPAPLTMLRPSATEKPYLGFIPDPSLAESQGTSESSNSFAFRLAATSANVPPKGDTSEGGGNLWTVSESRSLTPAAPSLPAQLVYTPKLDVIAVIPANLSSFYTLHADSFNITLSLV